jgi:hypothetical protein
VTRGSGKNLSWLCEVFLQNGTEISFGRPDEIRPKIVLFWKKYQT